MIMVLKQKVITVHGYYKNRILNICALISPLTLMPALVREVAVRLGWSSGPCTGTAAERTQPVPGRRSSTPSGLQANPPPAPRNHLHVAGRGSEEGRRRKG